MMTPTLTNGTLYPTRAEALRLIATCSFREFTKADWYGFQGCESESPMIGETKFQDRDILIVLDDEKVLMLYAMDGGEGGMYMLDGSDTQSVYASVDQE